jgi:hypothetical protein
MPKTIYAYRFDPFHPDAAEPRLLRNGVEVCLQLKAFEPELKTPLEITAC